VRNHRRDVVATTFKGETGNMIPIVCCQEHDASKRVLFDMCEMDETGETALQAYCRTYKSAPVSQAHALLRKARRLDSLVHPHRADAIDGPGEPYRQCSVCDTQYTPCFHWDIYAEQWYCHKCYRMLMRIVGSPR